ncbi:MAG TPA: hypothetical protein VFY91_03080 [Microbacterium sp.]|nr:hypothetical protein [Microbacterium sp.]
MKTVHTASASFLTGADIADAVMTYGLELARAESLDVIDIPFITARGSTSRAQLRIGWRIDTAVTYREHDPDELFDADAAFALLDKIQALRDSFTDRR